MRASFLLSIMFWVSLLFTPAFAQTPDAGASDESASTSTELPDPLTPDAARALVSQLSDEDVRALLLERLDLVAKEQEAKADSGEQVGIFTFLSQSIIGIGNNFSVAVQRLPNLFSGLQKGVANFLDGRGFGGGLQFVGLILAAVLAGLAACLSSKYLRAPLSIPFFRYCTVINQWVTLRESRKNMIIRRALETDERA